MAPPPPSSEYLASDFDSTTLTIPQLRSILLEHAVSYSNVTKKADLVALFDAAVRSQASRLLSIPQAKASSKGVTIVSENGSETASIAEVPAKRRGRPSRKTATAEPEEVEPPAKKPRGRTTRTATATVEPEEETIQVIQVPEPVYKSRKKRPVTPVVEVPSSSSLVQAPPVDPPSTSKRSRSTKREEVDDGANAEVEDETTPEPIARKGKGRASLGGDTPKARLSAPSTNTNRRRTIDPSSEILRSLGEPIGGKTPSKARSSSSLRNTVEVKEESEKEDEPVPVPKSVKKTPRKSVKEDPGAFSDYNPFQSGSEVAAERERRRRRSSIGLSQSKPRQPRFSEPAPKVGTPSGGGILRKVGPSTENLRTPSSEHRASILKDREAYNADDYNREVEERFDLDRHAQHQRITSKLAHEPASQLVKRVHDALPVAASPRFAIPASLLLLLLLSLVGNYKSNSASLGYCDPTEHTNDLILNRQSKLDNAYACVSRRAELELDNPEAAKTIVCDVKSLPMIPFVPRPTSCTPCPAHATCDDGALLSCEPEYILSHHPLAFLGPIVDGLPGVGPKAFPPTCRPDTARKRMIGGLAMEMEKDLAKGRGNIVCAGVGKDSAKKSDGAKYGVTEQTLKERFAFRRDPKFSREQFDELFDAALNDLVEHEDVIESIDVDGVSWYAASRTDLTIGCKVKMEFKDLLNKWKSQLGSTLAVLATIMWLRSTILNHKQEKYRAEELVQVVLKRLQDQETLHYADPVTTPNPFIPPAQLRDLVLPPTGSKTARNRLWQKVNDLVEANSNVAVREREVRGELWNTWEWQGVGERRVTWEQ